MLTFCQFWEDSLLDGILGKQEPNPVFLAFLVQVDFMYCYLGSREKGIGLGLNVKDSGSS